MPSAKDRGSMLPLFIVILATLLVASATIIDAGSLFLFRQHLQSRADQEAIFRFSAGERTSGSTLEVELCQIWNSPLKVLGLPTTQNVCAKSAAR
jgi:hypothetical protein